MNFSHLFHTYLDPSSLHEFDTCPGRFCGRLSNTTSACGTCPWGFRTLLLDSDKLSSVCEPCRSSLTLHEWLYLGFVFLLPVLFFFFVLTLIDKTPIAVNSVRNKRPCHTTNSTNSPINSANNSTILTPSVVVTIPKTKSTNCICSSQDRNIWILGLICIIIHSLAALITIIVFPPFGHLNLVHCPIYHLDDFYAPLLAAPGCSYEAVFPLTSLPLVYFGLSAIQSLLFYSILFNLVFAEQHWFDLLYYALYAYPILCVITTIFGGLLYYVYTYFLLILALIDSLYRFPLVFDYCSKSADLNLRPVCHPLTPLKAIIFNPGQYSLPLLVNLVCISYAILAHLQTLNWILIVSFCPFVFFLLTLPLSHPLLYYNGEEILNSMRNQDYLMHPRIVPNSPNQVHFKL